MYPYRSTSLYPSLGTHVQTVNPHDLDMSLATPQDTKAQV